MGCGVVPLAKQVQSRQVLERPDGPLGPELPPGPQILPKGREWKPIVVKWYDEFRCSPNASLVRTAPMWMAVQLAFAELDEMLSTGKYATLGPVVRQMFDQFGWTPLSLRSLKFDDIQPEDYAASAGGEGKVVDMEWYRKRILAAGG